MSGSFLMWNMEARDQKISTAAIDAPTELKQAQTAPTCMMGQSQPTSSTHDEDLEFYSFLDKKPVLAYILICLSYPVWHLWHVNLYYYYYHNIKNNFSRLTTKFGHNSWERKEYEFQQACDYRISFSLIKPSQTTVEVLWNPAQGL